MNVIFKSNSLQMFYKLDVLKHFAKFLWKHLRPVTVKERFQRKCFLENFAKFYELIFCKHLWTTAFEFSIRFTVFLRPSELIETIFFLLFNMFYHGFRTWWISWILQLENYTLWNIYKNSHKKNCKWVFFEWSTR